MKWNQPFWSIHVLIILMEMNEQNVVQGGPGQNVIVDLPRDSLDSKLPLLERYFYLLHVHFSWLLWATGKLWSDQINCKIDRKVSKTPFFLKLSNSFIKIALQIFDIMSNNFLIYNGPFGQNMTNLVTKTTVRLRDILYLTTCSSLKPRDHENV